MMTRVTTVAAVALSYVVLPLQSLAADGPVLIPKEGQGYQITRSDERSQAAPSGYEGRTDYSTLTAVGNTPATNGKRIVARFTMGNQIKICPQADGAAEGQGVFSIIIDYTDMQPTGNSRLHIDMRANAKYKGQVGDDAWIENPVKADIEYTYSLTGNMRDPSGALATPAGSNAVQNVTIAFAVGKDMTAPSFGAFQGGDPTQGHYAEAFSVGTALTYWAGIYYSMAQTQWRQDKKCVNVDFSPQSNTTRLVPGGKTTVEALVKTKGGEPTKARFQGARVLSNAGSVSPAEGPSDAGAPMRFTFTAPTQKVKDTGFTVNATSRGGVASAEWLAGLGTDWSGKIILSVIRADQGAEEMQNWTDSAVSTITVDLRNGKGTARGHTDVRFMRTTKQRQANNGSVSLVFASSTNTHGSLDDEAPATVEVINPTPGTYGIRVSYVFAREGTSETEDCARQRPCVTREQRMLIGATLSGMDGKIEDPNHLRGSTNNVLRGGGYRGNGTLTTTLTWDLSREGSTR